VAISFCTGDERDELRAIEDLIGQRLTVEIKDPGYGSEPAKAASGGQRGNRPRGGGGQGSRGQGSRGKGSRGKGSGTGRRTGSGQGSGAKGPGQRRRSATSAR